MICRRWVLVLHGEDADRPCRHAIDTHESFTARGGRLNTVRMPMMRTCLLILFGLLVPASGVAALATFTTPRPDGTKIVYYLQNVRHQAHHGQSILLLLQGSDCNSVARLKTPSKYGRIAPGDALLFVEKYGISRKLPYKLDENRSDCPVAYLRNNSLHQRVLDALLVLARLRKQADWWNGKLVIVGGSAGSNVGEELALVAPETRALIVFGYGGRHFEDDVINGIEVSTARSGASKTATRRELESAKNVFRKVRQDPTLAKHVSGHSYAYWNELLAVDQLTTLEQITVPVLAVEGGRDAHASTTDAKALMKALKAHGSHNITFLEYPSLNHMLRDSQGRSHLGAVIEAMHDWLVRTLAKPAR